MRSLLLLFGLCFAPLSWSQSSALESIAQRLILPALDSGQFVQERELKLFPQALRSEGRFAHVHEHGLLWQVEKPLQSELRILNGQVQERTPGGQWSKPLLGAQGSQIAAQLLTNLLSADLTALQEHFELQAQVSKEAWNLALRPKQSALQSMLKFASVSGQQQVQSLMLQFSNDERMHIQLQHAAAAQLSPDQAQALEFKP